MRKIFWILTLAATLLGGVCLVATIIRAATPANETAGILLSLATAVIPYIFTRSLEGLRHTDVMRVRIVGNERPRSRPEEHRHPEGRHDEARQNDVGRLAAGPPR